MNINQKLAELLQLYEKAQHVREKAELEAQIQSLQAGLRTGETTELCAKYEKEIAGRDIRIAELEAHLESLEGNDRSKTKSSWKWIVGFTALTGIAGVAIIPGPNHAVVTYNNLNGTLCYKVEDMALLDEIYFRLGRRYVLDDCKKADIVSQIDVGYVRLGAAAGTLPTGRQNHNLSRDELLQALEPLRAHDAAAGSRLVR